ncbi:hypothetical protein PDE_01537 [Penicillium oxalicum 114-2]|uniref:Uncharacterized protein n=1 Tax=Penicillium oxalicum (strain 114-2 / CGMCC 5302) TaxID=933388 RepID=S7Z7P1_PENO1|nr:hypothetical protein PDE_01537 [Penicillium oxalicum 114-2]
MSDSGSSNTGELLRPVLVITPLTENKDKLADYTYKYPTKQYKYTEPLAINDKSVSIAGASVSAKRGRSFGFKLARGTALSPLNPTPDPRPVDLGLGPVLGLGFPF